MEAIRRRQPKPLFARHQGGDCGARNFLFTNASGAVNPALAKGDLVLIRDQINNLGVSPLSGHQHLLQDAFVDMTAVYDPELRESIRRAAESMQVTMQDGVYMANHGPQFETPAEVRMAAVMGADMVGMSTVLEATIAHACGGRVASISLVTNMASGISPFPITHDDHLAISKKASKPIADLVKAWLASDEGVI